MSHHYFQNYTIITCYTYNGIHEYKEMYPIFVFAVLLFSSLLSAKAWQACAQHTEKKHSHTNSAFLRQVFVHALLVQHL